MARRLCLRLLLVGSALSAPGMAAAQQSIADYYDGVKAQIPNSGDVLFEAGTTVQRYHVDNIDIELSHLDISAVAASLPGGSVPANSYFRTTSNVLGVLFRATYRSAAVTTGNAQSAVGTLAVTLPCKNVFAAGDTVGINYTPTGVQRTASDYYGVYFTAPSYQQSYAAYRAYIDGNTTPSGYTGTQQVSSNQFRKAIYDCSAATSNQNPVSGNAESLQFRTLNDGLDLAAAAPGEPIAAETPEAVAAAAGSRNEQGLVDTNWGVGLRGGVIGYDHRRGYSVDARVNRSWRVLAGNRALLTVDVPVRYQRIQGGGGEWSGAGGVSLTLPVLPRWALEPRLAYGFVNSAEENLNGQLLTGTLASRLYFPRLIGRGMFTLGNMIGVSTVTHVSFAGQSINVGRATWSTRNGVAYEMPMRHRVLGRLASIRASYALSVFTGGPVYDHTLHEASVSLGVRARGDAERSLFETFRIGMISRIGAQYQSALGFVGYRF